jgi:hypothetical protein
MWNPLTAVAGVLARRLLGISADEIRYTFEDVRREIRAVRSELGAEIAHLQRDMDELRGGDRPKGMEIPVAEA